MKNILLLSSLIFVFLTACEEKKNNGQDVEYKSYISGLASPVKLNPDSTRVRLADYFPDLKLITEVSLDGQKLMIDTITGHAIITSGIQNPIGNLNVIYSGISHDIPVFATEKVKYQFTYKPTGPNVKEVQVSGSMNGWNRKASNLNKEGDVWKIEWTLNQGMYQYRIWEDGKEMMDAGNPHKIDNGMGAFNNTFAAGEVDTKAPRIITGSAKDEQLEITALDSVTAIAAYFENLIIPVKKQGNMITIDIPEAAKNFDRSHIRVFAANNNKRSNDLLIPLTHGDVVIRAENLDRSDMRTSVMYFMMVDRFADGDSSNNRPTADPSIMPLANNLGGDLAGITKKIQDGYFSNLGINTIWISPISTNAEGAWGLWDKGVRSTFSAYHGYWPTSLRTIDNRFGTDQQFRELIRVAHENDMNVILDYVAHHVHQDHPLYKQKPDWTTSLYLPDGTLNTEKWDEHRLTTWFDTFLPTWNFEKPEVVSALTDTAMYWIENYELDGFRHDATKHIPEEFWRELTAKVKAYKNEHPGRNIYQVGETYGSPELISSYINSGALDAQFDFNLYDAAVDAFAKDNTGFSNLGRVLDESLHYYGHHHVMGNITGNQDRARFTSYADGSVRFDEDAKLAGWTRKIENKDESGFEKMKMLNAFLLTTPGIPCIYYGDEIGMPGGNDPDNRRMMKFENWNPEQQKLHDITSKLVKLRRNNLALTYGDVLMLKNDDEALVYLRTYFGKHVLVILDKMVNTQEKWSVELPFPISETLKPEMSSGYYTISNNTLQCDGAGKGGKFVVEIFD